MCGAHDGRCHTVLEGLQEEAHLAGASPRRQALRAEGGPRGHGCYSFTSEEYEEERAGIAFRRNDRVSG